MPYETRWSETGVEWRYSGHVTAAETRLADAEFYGDRRADYATYQFIDLRDVTRLDFPPNEQKLTARPGRRASSPTRAQPAPGANGAARTRRRNGGGVSRLTARPFGLIGHEPYERRSGHSVLK